MLTDGMFYSITEAHFNIDKLYKYVFKQVKAVTKTVPGESDKFPKHGIHILTSIYLGVRKSDRVVRLRHVYLRVHPSRNRRYFTGDKVSDCNLISETLQERLDISSCPHFFRNLVHRHDFGRKTRHLIVYTRDQLKTTAEPEPARDDSTHEHFFVDVAETDSDNSETDEENNEEVDNATGDCETHSDLQKQVIPVTVATTTPAVRKSVFCLNAEKFGSSKKRRRKHRRDSEPNIESTEKTRHEATCDDSPVTTGTIRSTFSAETTAPRTPARPPFPPTYPSLRPPPTVQPSFMQPSMHPSIQTSVCAENARLKEQVAYLQMVNAQLGMQLSQANAHIHNVEFIHSRQLESLFAEFKHRENFLREEHKQKEQELLRALQSHNTIE